MTDNKAPQEKKELTQEEKDKLDRQRAFMFVLGEVTWLLSNSPAHKYNCFIGDLEWMVMNAIRLGQFKVFRSQDNQPAGLVIWAFVSDEIEEKLNKGVAKLRAKDWKSGENLWIIDIIAPYGNAEKMIESLKKTNFKDKKFKYQKMSSEGREVITENKDK